VATAPDGSVAIPNFPRKRMENDLSFFSELETISTFVPSGVRKATLGKCSIVLDEILMDPVGTNFDA